MGPPSLSKTLAKLVCNGQMFCVYPAAFESDEERRHDYELPDDVALENVELTTSDGVKLQCYYLPAQREAPQSEGDSAGNVSPQDSEPVHPRATVIMFHGNGYHVWHHVHSGKAFALLGCNALVVSYRGYGASAGSPSEKGLRRDAQAALDYVLSRPGLSQTRIIIHGHSLGGAVAIDLAKRNPDKIGAVIVENTFLSIPSVARGLSLLKYLTWVIHQRWDSASKIPSIPRTTPILMLSGALDQVVPPEQMQQLWTIAQSRGIKATNNLTSSRQENESKEDTSSSNVELRDTFVSFPRGDHADTWFTEGYWASIDQFLDSSQPPEK